MYIRKVPMWIKRDAVQTLADIYHQSVIPALRETDGCLFAALMQNVQNHHLCSSLTMWRSKEKAAEYEASGLYERLLASLRHVFQGPLEWQIDLPDDLKLDYAPTPERPAILGFEEQPASQSGAHLLSIPRFTHVLSFASRPDKIGEFRQHFSRNILSLYEPRKGFMDAYLMHRLDQHDSFFVLSFWRGTVDPSNILDQQTIDLMVERSQSVLSPPPMSHGPGGGDDNGSISRVSRCLRAEWFVNRL